MSIICKMFGHTRHKGWYGDGLYGDVHMSAIDGIGRAHAHITAECDRCHETYVLARFQPNSERILGHLAKHLPDDLRSALSSQEASK